MFDAAKYAVGHALYAHSHAGAGQANCEKLTIKVQLIVHPAGLQDAFRLHVVIHDDLQGTKSDIT